MLVWLKVLVIIGVYDIGLLIWLCDGFWFVILLFVVGRFLCGGWMMFGEWECCCGLWLCFVYWCWGFSLLVVDGWLNSWGFGVGLWSRIGCGKVMVLIFLFLL